MLLRTKPVLFPLQCYGSFFIIKFFFYFLLQPSVLFVPGTFRGFPCAGHNGNEPVTTGNKRKTTAAKKIFFKESPPVRVIVKPVNRISLNQQLLIIKACLHSCSSRFFYDEAFYPAGHPPWIVCDTGTNIMRSLLPSHTNSCCYFSLYLKNDTRSQSGE